MELDEFYGWMKKMVIPFVSTAGPYADEVGNTRPHEFYRMGPTRIVQIRHPDGTIRPGSLNIWLYIRIRCNCTYVIIYFVSYL